MGAGLDALSEQLSKSVDLNRPPDNDNRSVKFTIGVEIDQLKMLARPMA
jgi:hypothetical protein